MESLRERRQGCAHHGIVPNDIFLLSPSSEVMGTVFSSPKLMEQILLNLLPLDVLFIQGVNRTFKSVIANSLRLQQLLFLSPTDTSMIRAQDEATIFTTESGQPYTNTASSCIFHAPVMTQSGSAMQLNPFLSKVYPIPLDPIYPERKVTASVKSPLCPREHFKWNDFHLQPIAPPMLRPAQYHLFPSPASSPSTSKPHDHVPQSLGILQLSIPTVHTRSRPPLSDAKKMAISNPRASWRRMLLTQPPLFSATCYSACTRGAGRMWAYKGISLSHIAAWEDKVGMGCGPNGGSLKMDLGKVVQNTARYHVGAGSADNDSQRGGLGINGNGRMQTRGLEDFEAPRLSKRALHLNHAGAVGSRPPAYEDVCSIGSCHDTRKSVRGDGGVVDLTDKRNVKALNYEPKVRDSDATGPGNDDEDEDWDHVSRDNLSVYSLE